MAVPEGTLEAHLITREDGPADGYLPVWFALKNGIARQADLAALDALAEPYPRAHDDDAAFYATPRPVDHLDATALQVWQEFSGRFVRDDMRVLDLMASMNSHLPSPCHARINGLGMNAEELAGNPLLDTRIVHDLNLDPQLPWPDHQFDLVLCALSIEYLTRPEAVLRDVRRCLLPGGLCVISFSERWFPPKAVQPWASLPPFARLAWVLRHLQRSGFRDLQVESLRGLPRAADDRYIRQTPQADPLYAVWGRA